MYKHIMLPFDGTDLSRKAARECFRFAKDAGSKVTIIHVVGRARFIIEEGLESRQVSQLEKEYEGAAVQAARESLSGLEAEAAGAGVPCESIVVAGDRPYEQIIDKANRSGCDLIMMASHGRHPLGSLVLGSETLKVLSHCKTPVLVVR